MSRHERGLPGNPERRPLSFAERREKPSSLGVAVLIVGLDPRRNGENASDPLIWTITELKSKPETGKLAGEISIPAETRKNGESKESSVLGALAEFCDDTVFSSYVKRHLIKMDDKWYREKGIMVGAGPADVAVLIYDGALDFPFKPTYPEEVKPNGWVKKSVMTTLPRLRDLLKQVMELDRGENLIKDVVENYENNPEQRKSVFPEDLNSIIKFCSEREFGIDVSTMPWDAKEVAQRLPEAHRLIVEAIDLLVKAQGQEKRDYKREEAVVSDLKKKLKEMDKLDYAVGIHEVNGLGIKRVKVPKAFWEKDKEYREFYQTVYHEGGHDVYKLQPGESVEKSGGSWWLERGDSLGYPEEFGKDWCLIFGRRGGSNLRDYVIAPISGIKGLKLRPWDAYGM